MDDRQHAIGGTWTGTVIPEGLGATYPMGATGIATYRLKPGRSWTAGTAIPTPKAVQRIEVVTVGDRDVAIADGDVYVAGLPSCR